MEYVLGVLQFPVWSFKHGSNFFRSFVAHVKDHFIPHSRNNYHPHIFSHRMTVLFSGLMFSLKIFSIALISFGPVLPAFSSAITVENIINLTNQSRKESGLNALIENQTLNRAAQDKANDMLAKGYFSHNTPDGKTPWNFIQSAGYSYIMAGENLAVNFTEAENVETAWMNSPGHKANIVNKNFEEIGIGIAQGVYQDHTAIFVVQMFGTQAEQKITLSERPTVVEPQAAPVKITDQSQIKPSPVLAEAPTQPQAQPENTKPVLQQSLEVVPPQPVLEITKAETEVSGNTFNVFAAASANTVKVVLHYGQLAVMLDPKASNTWQAQLDLSRLASSNYTLRLVAYDMKGNFVSKQLASFTPSTIENFNVLGIDTKAEQVSWQGRIFNPKVLESQFYLLFIASILTSLIIAIVVHRHIQHVAVVANGSFLAIIACLLWMAS